MLTLAESIFLLCINDEKGSIQPSVSTRLGYSLASALVFELFLAGSLEMEAKGRLVLKSQLLKGDSLLDETLRRIQRDGKTHKPYYWISGLGLHAKQLRRLAAHQLESKGYITFTEKRFAWAIPCPDHPGQPGSIKYWLKQDLRAAVYGLHEPAFHQAALLAMVSACQLLDLVFTKDERKAVGLPINNLLESKLPTSAIHLMSLIQADLAELFAK